MIKLTSIKTLTIILSAMMIFTFVGCSSDGDSSSNSSPIANAGIDQTIRTGEVLTLDGSGSSDPDGTIDLYQWTNNTIGIIESPTPTEVVSGFAEGNHTVTLTVTDNKGATDTDSVDIVVLFLMKFQSL